MKTTFLRLKRLDRFRFDSKKHTQNVCIKLEKFRFVDTATGIEHEITHKEWSSMKWVTIT